MQNTSSLSREALSYLLQQGDRGKKEVVRIVAQEVNEFLRNMDLSSEVLKVLSNLQIEVNASVKFKQVKEGGVRPEITHHAEVTPVRDPNEPSSPPAVLDRDREGEVVPSRPPEGTSES
jgi:hypothetical protein